MLPFIESKQIQSRPFSIKSNMFVVVFMQIASVALSLRSSGASPDRNHLRRAKSSKGFKWTYAYDSMMVSSTASSTISTTSTSALTSAEIMRDKMENSFAGEPTIDDASTSSSSTVPLPGTDIAASTTPALSQFSIDDSFLVSTFPTTPTPDTITTSSLDDEIHIATLKTETTFQWSIACTIASDCPSAYFACFDKSEGIRVFPPCGICVNLDELFDAPAGTPPAFVSDGEPV